MKFLSLADDYYHGKILYTDGKTWFRWDDGRIFYQPMDDFIHKYKRFGYIKLSFKDYAKSLEI